MGDKMKKFKLDDQIQQMLEQPKKPQPLTGKELKKFLSTYKPIPNLQPGERVKGTDVHYGGYSGMELEVVNVFDPPIQRAADGSAYECDRLDFSAIFRATNGDIVEYYFDSRRFKRV